MQDSIVYDCVSYIQDAQYYAIHATLLMYIFSVNAPTENILLRREQTNSSLG